MNEALPADTTPADDFLGREAEFSALEAGLEQARAGRGALFLIGGEPGIGKSRLADEFGRQARGGGARVLWGKCWEDAGAPPYWPWTQALRAHLRTLDPATARGQLGLTAGDMAAVLPEIRQLLPHVTPPPADSDSARFQLFDSTASFLRSLADARVTVLVLDDLHAADTPSLLLLRFVASQLSDIRLLLIATYRDVELTPNHALTLALAELAREPVVRLVTLGGLREDSAARFIELAAGSSASARVVRAMWRETGGNPLFLREATRLLLSEGRLHDAGDAGSLRLAVPMGIRDVIARRVSRLPEVTVQVLTQAAALGPEFSVEVLRRLASDASPELTPALEEAVHAGLLTPLSVAPALFRFSHDLVRESLYQAQPSLARARLHRQIAQTIEELHGARLEAHLAELAHHWFEAAQDRDEPGAAAKAEHYARRSGELAARALAYEEAARHFRLALAMLDLQPTVDERSRTELLLALGDVDARAGELDTANAAFLQAADMARRTGVPAHLARAALGFGGRLPWPRPGSNPQLIPLLEEALGLLGEEDVELRVRLMGRLACAWRGSPEKRQQSDELSRRALELARRLDDPATRIYALATRYWATWWPENPEARPALAREMLVLAEAAHDAERLIDARLMLWCAYAELGDMAHAAGELAQVQRHNDALRQPAQPWLGGSPETVLALLRGDFGRAEELIGGAQEAAAPTPRTQHDISAASFHSFLLLRERGRPDEAEPRTRAAASAFPWYPLHRAALALLLLDLNRQDEARVIFDALAERDFVALYRDKEWLLGISLASEACSRLGDARAAAALYEQLGPFAGRHAIGHPEGSVGAIDRYLGLLAATMGRLDEAARHLADAVRVNGEMAARPWQAHSQADLAEVLRRRNAGADALRAEELERSALATARELGMLTLERRLTELVDEPVAPARPLEPGVGDGGTFRREGEYWTIAYGADAFRLRDSKGLRYLAWLLTQPGREILALELAQQRLAGSGGAARQPELRPADAGNVVTTLDEQAKSAYRERLRELREELDEAEAWNDPERADKARHEMDFLARELSRAVGLGGRDRLAGSARERARLSVTRAIRLAMGRIAEHSPELGGHLDATISTGTYCAYRPDPRAAVNWQT